MIRSKALKYAAYLIAGLFLGFFLFFPWNSLCDYCMTMGLGNLSANGIYGVVRSNECQGMFDKIFTYKGISVDFPAFRVTIREIQLDPSVLKTIFTISPSCRITLGRGNFTPVTRQKVQWNSGEAKVRLKNGVLYIEEIQFLGDFAASGAISFSAQNHNIVNANLTVKLPAEMDRPMQLIAGSGVLPITKISSGEWRIRK